MNDEKIKALWKWFLDNERHIRKCVENDSSPHRKYIVDSLDNLVLDMGRFSWQIGPGTQRPWFLTISPNGDRELMTVSKEIMSNAPDLDDWEFNYCRPAKNWDREFSLYDDNMIQQKINASNWKCIALNSEGGIEIMLEADNIAHLDNETARTAADIVVINEIGEEAKILNVCSVAIVAQLESTYDSRKTEIKNLRKHLYEISNAGRKS